MPQEPNICILFLKPEHQQYQITWVLVTNADTVSYRALGTKPMEEEGPTKGDE